MLRNGLLLNVRYNVIEPLYRHQRNFFPMKRQKTNITNTAVNVTTPLAERLRPKEFSEFVVGQPSHRI